MASVFSVVKPGPPIEVFALNKECIDDTFERKVNLIIGAYRTDESKPWVLPVVRKTEIMLASNENTYHEYLPILGSSPFSSAATSMLLGKESTALKEKRAFGVQTLSGTGALSIGARFLVQHLNAKHFYYSDPTWENHKLVFQHAGFEKGFAYRYWHAGKRGIDMDGLLEDLSKAEPHSVIILHACAHNPTGCDPTPEQWVQIANLMKEKKLFPFFDSAYQGFASGDLDEDAKAVRYFVDQGFELLCAQSFAKNFGLYSQRIGNLTFVVNDVSSIPAISSQVTIIVRGLYSNPPSHGSSIVSTVLNDPALFEEWKECIKTMSARIKMMRSELKGKLEQLKTPGTWEHITKQIGMFSYTGLTPAQVEYLKRKHHIYMLKSGRINMSALTSKNIDYVAENIHDAVVNVKE